MGRSLDSGVPWDLSVAILSPFGDWCHGPLAGHVAADATLSSQRHRRCGLSPLSDMSPASRQDR
jgi:hypothetical protein